MTPPQEPCRSRPTLELDLGSSRSAIFFSLLAARLLLSVEAGNRVVARYLRRRDYGVLLLHSAGAGLFCAQAA